MKTVILFVVSIFISALSYAAPKQYTVSSPDGAIVVTVKAGEGLSYSLADGGDMLICDSPVSMTLEDGTVYGGDAKVQKAVRRTVNKSQPAYIYKKAEVPENFNELSLKFKTFSFIVRVYNAGMAYRFVSHASKPFNVQSEQATFSFAEDWDMYAPYVRSEARNFDRQFYNSFENYYDHTPLSAWTKNRLAFLPLMVEASEGRKICITEADLLDYPGMYLYNEGGSTQLSGVYAPYPKELKQGGHNMLQMVVKSRESYIATYQKGTSFPWRIISVSHQDAQMADNDLVWLLSTAPSTDADFSWVKPGKVAWDWWNDWNIYGVDFRAGINNDTYKYYIDFASEKGIEYVILDEGWAVNLQADLFQVVPEIDLEELCAYAAGKNVGLILWAGYWAFDRDMEKVCEHYSKMGIKGFKIDFMDRDDQKMVDFHHRAAKMAAKYHLMVDFHGTYKPTGLQRTYPNVVNFEGVHGLEQLKWIGTEADQVEYDVIIPYVRMVAGPFDYTQGAMRNANKGNYRPVYTEAMSQGTRCRQLAEYVVFESPLNMLCDSPSNYKAEAECTKFIAEIPTIWDQTKALDGKLSDYIVMARRNGRTWYVGGMTDWTSRDIEVDLSFLGEGEFVMELYRDGVNADRAARDYKKETIEVPASRIMKVHMAPGGGFAAKITRK